MGADGAVEGCAVCSTVGFTDGRGVGPDGAVVGVAIGGSSVGAADGGKVDGRAVGLADGAGLGAAAAAPAKAIQKKITAVLQFRSQ